MDQRTAVFCAIELASLLCVAHLWWRGEGTRLQKIVWTPFLLLPIAGVFLYFAVHDPPGEQDESLQAPETRFDD
jgi:hypothetical protein